MSWDRNREYWPDHPAHYRPVPGWRRTRPHLMARAGPYGGGSRRPFMPDPYLHEPRVARPFVQQPRPHLLQQRTPFHGPQDPLYQDFNAPARPAQLAIRFETKSVEAMVEWKHPFVPAHISFTYAVTVEGGTNTETLDLPQWRNSIRLKVVAGTWYKVNVKAVSGPRTIAEGLVEFKAILNRDEMNQLFMKAVQFCGTNMHRFEHFYRNKPKTYWDHIRFERNHIMEKYIKDKNGQAGSPINDTIEGLFVSANLVGGTLPRVSPFGDVRLIIPAGKLYTPLHHLYFADFYCTYATHYITVVVCLPDSETDRHCAKTLVPLVHDRNPFLRVYERPSPMMGQPPWLEFWVNEGVWVETLYTENIHLDWGQFTVVQATGKSTPGGLPNNKYCPTCNLYPRARPKSDAKESDASSQDNDASRDDSEESCFNSTFHLSMELERERLGKDLDELGDAGVVETLCSLVDSVVAEVGELIEIPEHGFVGYPSSHYLTKQPKVITDKEAGDKTKRDKDGEGAKENTAPALDSIDKDSLSDTGKDILDMLRKSHAELDGRLRELGKSLSAIDDTFQTLDRKIRPMLAASSVTTSIKPAKKGDW